MAILGFTQEPTRNEIVAVGTSSIVISQPRQTDLKRKVILIRNTSPNSTDTITVNLGASPAVANAGIVLKQYESFSDAAEGGYDPFQGTVTAICATATGQLSVFER